MVPDEERIQRLEELMACEGIDGLMCSLPHNVLMLSGYLPVLCQSVVIFLADGDGVVIAPEAELFFAKDSWFREIRTFTPITMDYILDPIDTLAPLAGEICREKGIARGVIGIEEKPTTVPVPYLEIYVPNSGTRRKWAEVLPSAELRDVSDMLEEAAAVKSTREIERITVASVIAEYGFRAARDAMRVGTREVEVAAAAKSAMEREGTGRANIRRVGAWAFCMSGPRSADAYLPYQYSTNRHLERGDCAVVHTNCQADGYWTDLTRTFFVGRISDEQRQTYAAICEAWEAAVSMVGRGSKAADVDSAARQSLGNYGHANGFKHGTGHGVGFKAIYHGERPTIHPASDDVLENDMVFNIEPAVYHEGRWGMRVCDVVSVRGDGGKVLSSIPRDIQWAVRPQN